MQQRKGRGTHRLQHKGKRILKSEDSLRDQWDNIKQTTIHITGIPEEERKGQEKLYQKIVTENFPNLTKESEIQIQEIYRVPKK